MRYLPHNIPYPDNEKPRLLSLENLFREWYQHFANNAAQLEKHKAEDMVFDGFYPYYFSQKKRVLFIGREPRWIPGHNDIEDHYKSYREDKRIGTQSLNADKFHSRMLYFAYGIVHEMPEWQKIPYATEIGDTFATEAGLSFAFMNISKLSNNTGSWQTDSAVFNTAHRLSTEGRNFIQEEIAILAPHIVITMNLGKKISSLGQTSEIHASDDVESYWLDSDGHCSVLINTWHFSAWNKNDTKCFYEPIRDAMRRSETAKSVAQAVSTSRS